MQRSKTKDKSRKSWGKERGQALLELAIGFTLLTLILAVAFDGGRMFFSYIAVREAAQEGALYGTLNPGESSDIIARVRGSSSDPIDLNDASQVDVTVTNLGPACAGNEIKVTVSYHFTIAMPFLGGLLGTQQFPLTADAIGTVLNPAC